LQSQAIDRHMPRVRCGGLSVLLAHCQNICKRLTAFRLEEIEQLLSRYIDNIDCVVSAEAADVAEGRISVLPAKKVT